MQYKGGTNLPEVEKRFQDFLLEAEWAITNSRELLRECDELLMRLRSTGSGDATMQQNQSADMENRSGRN